MIRSLRYSFSSQVGNERILDSEFSGSEVGYYSVIGARIYPSIGYLFIIVM